MHKHSLKKDKKRKYRWISAGWWSQKPLGYFSHLLTFANTQIEASNWEHALWQAMGTERFCTVTSTSTEGTKTLRMYAADIADGDAYDEVRYFLPQIFGKDATLKLTNELQVKLRMILDRIMTNINLVDRQRRGQEDSPWRERAKGRDVGYKLFRRESNYEMWPWDGSHFEEYQELHNLIKQTLNSPETRKATIYLTGFICFEDEGDEATITLGWMLRGLVDVLFEGERAVLRKCPWCENYYIHETLKPKTFCTDKCRYNFRNKRR